ncbi:MAG: hypothetical protein M3430_02145, partial [Acidobacteriota bacterium]|nr:hypothetical protein [Acidobacteriota bacterium]
GRERRKAFRFLVAEALSSSKGEAISLQRGAVGRWTSGRIKVGNHKLHQLMGKRYNTSRASVNDAHAAGFKRASPYLDTPCRDTYTLRFRVRRST